MHPERGELQDCLDRIRCERRTRWIAVCRTVRLEDQRGDAADDAGGHAGPAQRHVVRADAQSGVVLIQRGRSVRIGNQFVAGRDDVRFQEPVVPRRAARAIGRHHIIAATGRAVRIDGADRNR